MESKQQQIWNLQTEISRINIQLATLKNVLADAGIIEIRDGQGHTWIQLKKKKNAK